MIAGRAPLAAGAAAQERDLVRRCRAGSEAAYTELIAAHGRRLFRLAVRLSGSRATAEDAAQATFRGAFRSIERGEERLPLAAWLTGRCVQEARRREPLAGRDRQRTRGHGLPAGQPERAPIVDALASLPFEARAVLVLRFAMGLSADETAAALDISSTACHAHLSRGLGMLARAIGPDADSVADPVRDTPRAAPTRPQLRPLGAPSLARSDER